MRPRTRQREHLGSCGALAADWNEEDLAADRRKDLEHCRVILIAQCTKNHVCLLGAEDIPPVQQQLLRGVWIMAPSRTNRSPII